ncbi:MAG: hypothetical protein Q9220_002206 [cf. Caloplaca sp. 1 TL-2023]
MIDTEKTEMGPAAQEEIKNEKQAIHQEPSRSVSVPKDEPINDTFLRRTLTLLATKIPRSWKKHPREDYFYLPHKKLLIRRGRGENFTEAQTIQFIARHTSIPVSKIYCSFKKKGQVYLVTEWIEGHDIASGWRSRSEQSKTKLLDQLRHMITEMRQIPHPEHLGVASVTGGPVHDGRLSDPKEIFGPFKTVADFHLHVREGFDEDHTPERPELGQVVVEHREPWQICFTHGDLNAFNIIVRGDEVAGIIDWENAGWLPSYWEYTNAWHVNPFNTWWQDEVDKFLEREPKGLAMDRLRRKYWSMFGSDASYCSLADA